MKVPRILIKHRCGEKSLFDVHGYEDYLDLIQSMTSWFTRWVSIGSEAFVRKKDIAGIFYVGEYTDAKDSDSGI